MTACWLPVLADCNAELAGLGLRTVVMLGQSRLGRSVSLDNHVGWTGSRDFGLLSVRRRTCFRWWAFHRDALALA